MHLVGVASVLSGVGVVCLSSVEGGFRLWFSSEECAGVWLTDGGFDGGKVSEAHVLCTRKSCCLSVRQSPILSQ